MSNDTRMEPQNPSIYTSLAEAYRKTGNKPASEAEMTTFDDLMAKANTMSEADFKAYISQHRASVDAQGRGKDFIKKDAEGRYEVLPCLYNFVSRA